MADIIMEEDRIIVSTIIPIDKNNTKPFKFSISKEDINKIYDRYIVTDNSTDNGIEDAIY